MEFEEEFLSLWTTLLSQMISVGVPVAVGTEHGHIK